MEIHEILTKNTVVYPRLFLAIQFLRLFARAGRKNYPIPEKISQKRTTFVFGNTYLHQTFTECVPNQYTHFDIFACQICLQVMEHPLILLKLTKSI